MRNLVKHPITKAEKLEALSDAIVASRGRGLIGDIQPEALRQVCREWYQAQYGSLWRDPVWGFGVALGALIGALAMFALCVVIS